MKGFDFEALCNAVSAGATLTPEEREAVIDHTMWCAEGEYTRQELEALSDYYLARACYGAMCDWVNCNT